MLNNQIFCAKRPQYP